MSEKNFAKLKCPGCKDDIAVDLHVFKYVDRLRRRNELLERVKAAASDPDIIDWGTTGEHHPVAMQQLRDALADCDSEKTE